MTLYPCTIGLGSNTPDRETRINEAITYVKGLLTDPKISSIYESEAFNGKDKPYLNAVIHGMTHLSDEKLIEELKSWETKSGRTVVDDESVEHEVVIDLDLVIYNFRILRQNDFDRHYFNKGYRELLAHGAFVSE